MDRNRPSPWCAARCRPARSSARRDTRRGLALVFGTLRVLRLVDLGDVVAALRVEQEVSGNAAIGVGLVLQAFRGGSVAEIEIAREAGVAREMRVAVPHLVVFARPLVALFEEFAIVFAGGLLGFVDRQDHRRQKRRLRARQEVGAVGIQHRAVVLDLEEEVLDDAARQIESLVFDQSAHDEVACPSHTSR